MREPARVSGLAWGSRSFLINEWFPEIHITIDAVALHAAIPSPMQFVDPQAVLFFVDDFQQFCPHCFESNLINCAFKNGKLDTLPKALALLCNSPKAASAFLCFGIYVI